MAGRAGRDELLGERGADTLEGGLGDDLLDMGGDYEAQQRCLRTAGLRWNFSHRKKYIRNSRRGYFISP